MIICRPCLNKLDKDILEFETGRRGIEVSRKCENKKYVESCYFSFLYYFLFKKHMIPVIDVEELKKIYQGDNMSLFNPQWIQNLENFIASAEADKASLSQTLSEIKTAISDVKSVVSSIQADVQVFKNQK